MNAVEINSDPPKDWTYYSWLANIVESPSPTSWLKIDLLLSIKAASGKWIPPLHTHTVCAVGGGFSCLLNLSNLSSPPPHTLFLLPFVRTHSHIVMDLENSQQSFLETRIRGQSSYPQFYFKSIFF